MVDADNRRAVEQARRFAARVVSGEWDGRKAGMYLYGQRPGTGKTYLAEAVANAALDAGVWVRFVRVVDIPRNDQEAVEELASDEWPLVVLDDVGAAKPTPRLVECLYAIIDGRTWRGAPLVVTSNLEPDALGRQIGAVDQTAGERIASRLVGACELVPVGGPDRRRGRR